MSGYELIRSKHFTFVQVFMHKEGTDDYRDFYGVILEPHVAKARPRVVSFLADRFPGYKAEIHLYPRTYVRDALNRYAQGHVIPTEEE